MPESVVPSVVQSAPRSARERVRLELTSEIKQVALAQLASSGGAALSLRAIAREMGMASSVLALARNIAGAFGIALFGTLLSNSLGSAVLNTARNSAVHATSALQFQQGATLIILHSYIVSYHTVFYVAAFVLFFGAILAFFIKPKVEITDVQVHVE